MTSEVKPLLKKKFCLLNVSIDLNFLIKSVKITRTFHKVKKVVFNE